LVLLDAPDPDLIRHAAPAPAVDGPEQAVDAGPSPLVFPGAELRIVGGVDTHSLDAPVGPAEPTGRVKFEAFQMRYALTSSSPLDGSGTVSLRLSHSSTTRRGPGVRRRFGLGGGAAASQRRVSLPERLAEVAVEVEPRDLVVVDGAGDASGSRQSASSMSPGGDRRRLAPAQVRRAQPADHDRPAAERLLRLERGAHEIGVARLVGPGEVARTSSGRA
jgi:hypothetical protein